MAPRLTRRNLSQLSDYEQRYAMVGAWLGGAASVALWAPSWGKSAGIALSAIGVIMAGLLALAARRRSRLFTGLACLLLSFGPWGMAWVIGLPYLVLAGFLVLKSPRVNPRLDAEVDENGEIVETPSTEEPAPARTGRRSRRKGGNREDEDATPAPRCPPSASKRYTPPQHRS